MLLISNKSIFVVSGGKIINISLEHNYERGERAETIINDIIDNQTLKVDTISGVLIVIKLYLNFLKKP